MKRKKELKKQFDTYAKPMIIRSIFQSLMHIGDKLIAAIFIGASALVATTLISPLMFLVGSIAMFFISGLGAYIGLLLGLDKVEKANKISSGIIVLMALVGIALTIPGVIFSEQFAYFLGARGHFFELSVEYLRIFSYAFPLLLVGRGLDVLILNDGSPQYSFRLNILTTILNLLINIFTVVVLNMGIKGLALATVFSSGVQFVGGIGYFAMRSKVLHLTMPTFSLKTTLRIMYNGLSDFAMTVVEAVMVYVINIAFITYLTPMHFEAYAATSMIFTIFYSIYMGASMGLQPILSKKMGQKKFSILKGLIHYSIKKSTIYGVVAYGVVLVFIDKILVLFIDNPATIELGTFFYLTIGLATVFSNYPLQMSIFFTAINRPLESAAISIVRTLFLIPVFTYLLIRFFGAGGVAMGYILADIIMIIGLRIFMKQINLASLKVYE